jgi:hypothetical protein
MLFGSSPALIDHRLWYTIGNETRGDLLLCPKETSVLDTVARHSVAHRGQLERLHTPRSGIPNGRLMMEAASKVGPSFHNAGTGFALQVPSIKDTQDPFVCEGHHGVDLLLIGHVPWRQRAMATHTAFIVPHRLHFGPGLGRTPSRAGTQL